MQEAIGLDYFCDTFFSPFCVRASTFVSIRDMQITVDCSECECYDRRLWLLDYHRIGEGMAAGQDLVLYELEPPEVGQNISITRIIITIMTWKRNVCISLFI